MKLIRRHDVLCVAALIIAVMFALFAGAQEVFADEPTTNYQVVIYDDADLLSAEEEIQLYNDMLPLAEYGNVVFTSVELEGWQYEKFAEDTYYNLFGNQPGVLLQIDMGNRKLTLSTSARMDKMVGSERDSIIDNVYKLATNGDYYGCASKCFSQVYDVINGQKIAHQMKYIDNAIFALILALILNFFVVFATTRRRINKKKVLGEIVITTAITDLYIEHGKVTKRKTPKSSGGGGFFGGGGFGGGGFSGGSSSHGF